MRSGFYSPDFVTLGIAPAGSPTAFLPPELVDRRVVPQAGLQLHHDRDGAGGRAADVQRQAGRLERARLRAASPIRSIPVGNPHFYGSNADGTIYQHSASLPV